MSFKEITNSINKDLDKFENLLQDIANDSDIAVSGILDYIFEAKGKRVRPILVYLTNRLFSEPNQSTHHAAVLVELMHTATLLHDDVVDKAALRRGKTTVNNKWDDKTAVLTGDYLFAKAMKLATDNDEYKLFDIITPAIMRLSLGELQQMNKSKSFDISKNRYFEVIKNKTASLISVCCKSGAYTGGADERQIALLEEFGELLGMIFQIKDDILDYNGSEKTGKLTGIDILENKITLPVICTWKNMCVLEQRDFKELWLTEPKDQELVDGIIKTVIFNKGISGSYAVIDDLKKKALQLLAELPDSKAKAALIKLLDYIIDRDK